MWSVAFTEQFGAWFESLGDENEIASIRAVMRVLRDEGPTLGRPLVDRIQGSRYQNMKELRPLATNIRILFAFDPERTAILLIGGDKTGEWDEWYRRNIPVADDLFSDHLHVLEERADKDATDKRGKKRGGKR